MSFDRTSSAKISDQGPFAQTSLRLLERGYYPVPITVGVKYPTEDGWQKMHVEWQPTADQNAEWANDGVGVLCGYGFVAIDIDTDDQTISQVIKNVIGSSHVSKRGRKGETFFFRMDNPPPKGIWGDKDYHIHHQPVLELLSTGQQTLIPPTIHPDTKKPYKWTGSCALQDVAPADLPELPDNVVELLTTALAPLGITYKSKTGGKKKNKNKPANGHATGEKVPFFYCDADGKTLYRNVRVPLSTFNEKKGKLDKTFVLERKLPNGVWERGLDGIKMVPYRLNELVSYKPGDTILIPEGEAKADALFDLGFKVTNIQDGAKDFGHYFDGMHVVILRDNDDKGVTRADSVATEISKHKPASLKTLDLPGLFVGGDVLDWLDSGGTAEALRELISELAVDWVASSPTVQPDQNGHENNDSPFHQINQLALANLDAWVPSLLEGKPNWSKEHDKYKMVAWWRPSNTGREYEQRDQNLHISSKGIKDFGDGKGYSAIDLVMYAKKLDARMAKQWLERKLTPTTKDVGEKADVQDHVIEELNAKYCLARYGNKVAVMFLEYDKVLERSRWVPIQIGAFRTMYQNRKVMNNGKWESWGSYWLNHKEREQYLEGIVFDPTGKNVAEGQMNLWTGFAVKPGKKKKGWSKLQRHLFENVCQKSIECYEYLVNWMANCAQKPGEPGQVAVVFRGGKGVGKGKVGNILRYLFGQHGGYISHPKHLTGTFNAHLRDCVLLFADEAFYAGDKAGESNLKALITDPVMPVEAKGFDVQMAANMLHIIMSSNKDWVIPASADERRFFVLDVGEEHKQDKPYFAAIDAQMKNGGYEAMLYDLLHRDLNGWDVRDVPQTKALYEQKILSEDSKTAWLRECMVRGHIYETQFATRAMYDWNEWVTTKLLIKSYEQYCKKRNVKYPVSTDTLTKTFLTVHFGESTRHRQEEIVGEIRGQSDGTAERLPMQRGYTLGSRKELNRKLKMILGVAKRHAPKAASSTNNKPAHDVGRTFKWGAKGSKKYAAAVVTDTEPTTPTNGAAEAKEGDAPDHQDLIKYQQSPRTVRYKQPKGVWVGSEFVSDDDYYTNSKEPNGETADGNSVTNSKLADQLSAISVANKN
jgi:hypothetical protein